MVVVLVMNNVPSAALKLSALGCRARPPAITALMKTALETPGLLSLAAGFTDNATLPVTAVAGALHGLAVGGSNQEFLQYGTNSGRPGLRAALAARLLRQDGCEAAAADTAAVAEMAGRFFITNGSQQALYLAIQTLCEPGDIVLVDRPSYFVFLELWADWGSRRDHCRWMPLGGWTRLRFARNSPPCGPMVRERA